VEGTHLVGQTDADVQSVLAVDENTLAAPPVLCRQFTNLRSLVVIQSYLDFMPAVSFAECRNLEQLELPYNRIYQITDEVFINSPNLTILNLSHNRLNRISDRPFVGTSIRVLDLSYNQIMIFNPEWDQPINETLQELDVSYNRIQIIGTETFGNIRNLRNLVLNGNFMFEIGGKFRDQSNILILNYFSTQQFCVQHLCKLFKDTI
jgi:leucine-rich repeat-containing G protein-coupled receptor 8